MTAAREFCRFASRIARCRLARAGLFSFCSTWPLIEQTSDPSSSTSQRRTWIQSQYSMNWCHTFEKRENEDK